ncbi:adenosylcobinamide-phosphate synthase CbiB [Curvibacter sp. CHRR-16]|uniref:adenosylcobinamide-phosphate synthase CbiB n=1 Tax=Curvibacter sp. CHRR-16 TaxID=2835872 RepID=UPI0032EA32CF
MLPLGAVALLLALAWDRWLGEPPVRWHPVVWMGHYLQRAGHWLHGRCAEGQNFKAFWLGSLMWCAGAAMVLIASLLLQGLCLWLAAQGVWGFVLGAAIMGVCLKPLLAWRMLVGEVQAVESHLSSSAHGDLPAARSRLRSLVSRDTAHLSATEVRESAIESLAENFNDSVLAAVWWFVLLGLTGAALWRYANTADAMWGYPGERHGRNWAWAGKWAARTDDVLAWLPARWTALLLWVVARFSAPDGGQPFGWAQLAAQARQTPSPNSGWPMAAMALALGVRLSKPQRYVLNPEGQGAQAVHTAQAIALVGRVGRWGVAMAVLVMVLFASVVAL